MSEDEKKKDSFIQEQIRKKPFYRRKSFRRTVRGVAVTVIFGVSAGGTFAFVQPFALHYMKEKDKMVVVGGETESETAATEQEMAAPLEEAAAQKPDLNDYEQFYTEMAEIADETKRSIVTVTGVTSELDLFNDVSESHSSTAGVIISKTEGTLLILTEKNTISDADSIKVTFEDGSIADGWLQASDEISDLAVVKVFSRELGETTAAYVEAAEFADSGETTIGDPIIALSAGYVSFGMVTAQPYLYLCDGSYQRINTDIIGKNENGGILMNLDGQVVGILGPDTKNADSSTLNGVGISEIGGLVNALASRTSLPYFGILGKDVTDALSKELNMPKGVIVMQVEEGSPAMENGIQATDVITSLDGSEVESMQDYMAILRDRKPGDTISVSLWRKGKSEYKETKVNITLTKR